MDQLNPIALARLGWDFTNRLEAAVARAKTRPFLFMEKQHFSAVPPPSAKQDQTVLSLSLCRRVVALCLSGRASAVHDVAARPGLSWPDRARVRQSE